MRTRLTLIIPCYNAEPYIYELLDRLAPQITKEVEVILVDDGSDKPFSNKDHGWVKVIRQDNKGLAKARNVALDIAKGEYIGFIDADDLVSETYVKDILDKTPFDYLEMSWKSLQGGFKCDFKLKSDSDYLTNPSVCTRAFSKAFIGKNRFNENKDATEDEDFSRKLGYMGKTDYNRKVITDYTYFYRTAVENSLSKRYLKGLCNTKRIVYYFPEITANMTYLLDEIKQEDQYNEVWVMTHKCDIPELKRYAQVVRPQHISGMELRGENTPLFSKISIPLRGQIVIWTNRTYEIGGIETFIYNFCSTFKDYDIIVLYNEMHPKQIERLRPYARVIKNNTKTKVYCDIMLINRIIDKEPDNIIAKKKIQMVHTCNYLPTLHVPQGRHATICVSEIVKSSFQKETEESIVIKNIVPKIDPKRVLLLVTASRFDTTEKGQKRMDKLASAMDEKGIPYIWLYFSNVELKNAPKNLIRMQPTLDIANYMAMADYLVQLSDVEAFGYSIAEALNLGVPVLTTPIDVLPELGFVDGVTGYILPFDMKDIDIEKIYNSRLKGFKYKYDNDKIVNQWKEILGNPKPCSERQIDEPLVRVKAIITYYDIVLGRKVFKNDELEMKSKRAYELLQKNFIVLV